MFLNLLQAVDFCCVTKKNSFNNEVFVDISYLITLQVLLS